MTDRSTILDTLRAPPGAPEPEIQVAWEAARGRLVSQGTRRHEGAEDVRAVAVTADPKPARVESIIHKLKAQGVAVLLISHNFDQVLRLSDHVWVMRGGLAVAERRAAETDGDELVALITGAKAA